MTPLSLILGTTLAMLSVQADIFHDIFGQHMGQEQESFDYQRQQLDSDCNKYLCPESFACVSKPIDCPCPFPDSQQKCVLPDKKSYVCIAKTDKADLKDFKGEIRDCSWVRKAYKGKV